MNAHMSVKIFSLLLVVSLLLAGCSPALPSQPAASRSQQPTISVPTQAASGAAISAPATPTTGGGGQPAPTTIPVTSGSLTYPLVDTAQGVCYDDSTLVACPVEGQAFYGQDAQYSGNQPRYQDNGDGTVTDLVTGLMWQQDPGDKMTYNQAVAGAASFNLAGYKDWRLPSIKELYSLILFDGTDVSACPGGSCQATPFIDTRYFDFQYGDTDAGERVIDSQFASSTHYVSTVFQGVEAMFGVNFADGRIKGYPTGAMQGQSTGKLYFVLYVRGGSGYGVNDFVDNGDGTITDNATGLTWMQSDSGAGMNWGEALAYCENASVAGYADWRLPDAKQLHSIVDYSRSPDTTSSAAIDPLFSVTSITDEAGRPDYPFYWSSTTHASSNGSGQAGVYVAFGEALGYMQNAWIDVHGAGAQRSDPKSGSAADYPTGHGPQGDAVRVANYVRCVRGGSAASTPGGNLNAARPSMTIQSTGLQPGTQPGAQGGAQPGGQGQPGGLPPQEAINACSALSAGDVCQFTTPNGTVSGTCALIQQQLACVPAGGPPPGDQP